MTELVLLAGALSAALAFVAARRIDAAQAARRVPVRIRRNPPRP